jgi:hypothetical protein
MAEYPTTSTGGGGRIQAAFDADHASRYNQLQLVRELARLTIPSELPPDEQQEDQLLPENYQSLGSRGVTNLTSKALLGAFPPDRLWVQEEVSPEIRNDPTISPELIQEWDQFLFLRNLTVIAALESAHPSRSANPAMLSFRGIMRMAVKQILLGDTLVRESDDFRLTVFRRDRYVTRRNCSCDVLYHITWEDKDPLNLTDEQLETIKLKPDELKEKPAKERAMKLYTRIEWQPRGQNWKIDQEINGHIFNTSEEPVTNHFSGPFDLSPGEHYGRGIVELNRGDLSSYDALSSCKLDFAAAGSRFLQILDPSSSLKEVDMRSPSGTVLRDKVENGVPTKMGMFQSGKLQDFQMVHLAMQQIRADLGKNFLIDSESVRDSERTTAFEVQEVTIQELQGNLAGVYEPVSALQIPMFLRTKHLLERKGLIETLKKEDGDRIRVIVVGGIEALVRQARSAKMAQFIQFVKGLGPQAEASLDYGVLLGVFARLEGINEPGVIKSQAKRQQEQQEALALEAQRKAIDVTGNVVESQATQGAGLNGTL